jgi:folate-binding protein YgfZ
VTDLARVEGADAATYLQGQLSQDIDALAVGAEAWSFLLEPSGHIAALVLVERVGEESFVLHADGGLGERVAARLRKFLLRTKATITLEAGEAEDEPARIAARRPGAAEFDERAVPAETGWVDRAVSFTKGCYTGQELVARMDSRVAEPPRRLVAITASDDLPVGAAIEVDGAEVGAVTSAAGAVALGYVKRGARLTGEATVGGAPATMEGPVGG